MADITAIYTFVSTNDFSCNDVFNCDNLTFSDINASAGPKFLLNIIQGPTIPISLNSLTNTMLTQISGTINNVGIII